MPSGCGLTEIGRDCHLKSNDRWLAGFGDGGFEFEAVGAGGEEDGFGGGG
jgi:hypothetical protein